MSEQTEPILPSNRFASPDLYAAMVRYLLDCGWCREEEGSSWWWRDGFDEATIGGAVEEQMASDGLDARMMLHDEQRRFWG